MLVLSTSNFQGATIRPIVPRHKHFNVKCQFNPGDLFKAQSLIIRRETMWKPLFEVNFRQNSTKTIRLFALDFYEVIETDYHLIEISSS